MNSSPSNPVLGDISKRPVAPNFQVQDHQQTMHSLSDFRGKFVILNFWASWCDVCRSEKPGLEAFKSDFQNDDVVVMALASDSEWDAIREALPKGTPLNIYLDPPANEGGTGRVASSYGVEKVPETFIIDREGRIRSYLVNRRDWNSDVVETCVRSMLDEKH